MTSIGYFGVQSVVQIEIHDSFDKRSLGCYEKSPASIQCRASHVPSHSFQVINNSARVVRVSR